MTNLPSFLYIMTFENNKFQWYGFLGTDHFKTIWLFINLDCILIYIQLIILIYLYSVY